MKKKILLLLLVSMLFAGVASAASLWGTYKGNPIIKVAAENKLIEGKDVPAISFNGRTMIPLYMLKELGINYTWDAKNQTVNISPPSNSKSDYISINELAKKYGAKGKKYANAIEFSSLNGEFTEIVFYVNVSFDDKTRDEDYTEMLNDAVNTGADHIKIVYRDYTMFIFTIDLLDFWNNKITVDEYVSRIKLEPNNSTQDSKDDTSGTYIDIIPDVIESKIEGTFEGFNEGNIYKLDNGQLWEQTDFKYKYSYKYRPAVTIYKDGSAYYMKVDGVDGKAQVKLIN